MSETILRLKPEQVIQEIQNGQIEVVRSNLRPAETPRAEAVGVERAKGVFGENFLGEEAIHVMEAKLKKAGVDVKFEIPTTNFPYTEADIEKARQDESRGRGRMVVLRPEWMFVKERNKDIKKPVNILNLRALLKDKNPFGSGVIFYNQGWYNDQDFAKQPLTAGYAMPTREIITGSTSTTWNDQQNLLEPGERRREANEAVWDTILYYASTGKKVLETRWDWTATASDDDLVYVGYFGSDGLYVDYRPPSYPLPYIGVCPSR